MEQCRLRHVLLNKAQGIEILANSVSTLLARILIYMMDMHRLDKTSS
jgi:hypothetical protein